MDTMIPSDGAGDGRGTSPIPIVKLGARLNEPEEPATGGEQQVLQREAKASTEGTIVQGDDVIHLADEPQTFVSPENQEADTAVAGETKAESVDTPSADFEPIYETMVTVVADDKKYETREPAAEESSSQLIKAGEGVSVLVTLSERLPPGVAIYRRTHHGMPRYCREPARQDHLSFRRSYIICAHPSYSSFATNCQELFQSLPWLSAPAQRDFSGVVFLFTSGQ